MRQFMFGATTSILLWFTLSLGLEPVSAWYLLASPSPSSSCNTILQSQHAFSRTRNLPLFSRHQQHQHQHQHQRAAATASSSSSSLTTTTRLSLVVGPRIAIYEDFEGLQRIHSDPDIYIIQNFLNADACRDLIQRAQQKKLDPSPVAYAGWTEDFKDLTELVVKGPVTWLAILGAWFQTKEDSGGVDNNNHASIVDLVIHMVQNFGILAVVAVAGIAAFTKSRADGLQQLRTSTSTTLDDLSDADSGTAVFVRRTAELFTSNSSSSSAGSSGSRGGDGEAASPLLLAKQQQQQQQATLFEAPTVIRYEAGQVLAPHYDANRSAQVEDANRGGQTLATLIVYLNDVQRGGLTRFGKIPASSTYSSHAAAANDDDDKFLTIQPKMGDALLFFPADASGTFDERTEHEGCPAVDEKWIARIWRHANRVPPPFGLDEVNLARV